MDYKLDTRVKLSLMWVVLMINMIFNDIFTLMVYFVSEEPINNPGDVKIVMAIAAIVTNIPIFMILLSRLLKYKVSRILNIVVGFFTIIYVVGGGDLSLHYVIIAAIEVVLAIIIIVTAWRWKEIPEALS